MSALLFLFFSNKFDPLFIKAGQIFNIDPLLIKAIAIHESSLNPKAINYNKNGTKDYGLMQINTYWVKKLKLSPYLLLNDPWYNIYWGTYILYLKLKENNFTFKGVAKYHSNNTKRRRNYLAKIIRIYAKLKREERKCLTMNW